jgi:hypothetical protein
MIETIDWYFRFRGRLIHKVCHFFLMETTQSDTAPQRAEGITACQWVAFAEASDAISYANARQVLRHAHEMIEGARGPAVAPIPSLDSERADQLGLGLDAAPDERTEDA